MSGDNTSHLEQTIEIKLCFHFRSFPLDVEVKYKQWVTVDRCHLLEKTEDFDDFSTSLSERMCKLTRHCYITKSQEIFLQNLKSNLIKEVIISKKSDDDEIIKVFVFYPQTQSIIHVWFTLIYRVVINRHSTGIAGTVQT